MHVMKKYNKLSGSMGCGKEYGMSTENRDEGSVFEDYALSMQLSNQNMQLQQQLQQQQMAISQLQYQMLYAGNNNNN